MLYKGCNCCEKLSVPHGRLQESPSAPDKRGLAGPPQDTLRPQGPDRELAGTDCRARGGQARDEAANPSARATIAVGSGPHLCSCRDDRTHSATDGTAQPRSLRALAALPAGLDAIRDDAVRFQTYAEDDERVK